MCTEPCDLQDGVRGRNKLVLPNYFFFFFFFFFFGAFFTGFPRGSKNLFEYLKKEKKKKKNGGTRLWRGAEGRWYFCYRRYHNKLLANTGRGGGDFPFQYLGFPRLVKGVLAKGVRVLALPEIAPGPGGILFVCLFVSLVLLLLHRLKS